jgi:hypothetical protein
MHVVEANWQAARNLKLGKFQTLSTTLLTNMMARDDTP